MDLLLRKESLPFAFTHLYFGIVTSSISILEKLNPNNGHLIHKRTGLVLFVIDLWDDLDL
jgi:hypothetical protein